MADAQPARRRRRVSLPLILAAAALGATPSCSTVSHLAGRDDLRLSPSSTTATVAADAVFRAGAGAGARPAVGGSGDQGWMAPIDERGGRRQSSAEGLCAGSVGSSIFDCGVVTAALRSPGSCAPVVPTTATRSKGGGSTTAEAAGACRPPALSGSESDLRFGWTLSGTPTGTRTLSIFRGGDVLFEVLRAVDSGGVWAEAVVCPRDVDADGVVEAIISHRSVAQPDVVIIDVVDFSPSVRRLDTVSLKSPLAEGEGCQAPAVSQLGIKGTTPVTPLRSTRASARS